jgi:hypothetical protein
LGKFVCDYLSGKKGAINETISGKTEVSLLQYLPILFVVWIEK